MGGFLYCRARFAKAVPELRPEQVSLMNMLALLNKYRDLVLPVAIIGCVGVILVPLPTILIDILLAANVAVAILVLLTTIYIRTPLEFNVFPTLLVATTLARLV